MMPLGRAEQVAQKEDRVRAALSDVGVASPAARWVLGPELGYRNRIRLRILHDGTAAFYNRQKSLACTVLEPPLRGALDTFAALCRGHPGLTGSLDHVELRTRDLDGRFALSTIPRSPGADPGPELQSRLGSDWIVAPRESTACQRHALTAECDYYVPVGAFMQINTHVAQQLVEHVSEGAHRRSARTFLDLFCGAGNFSVALGRLGLDGEAVDSNRQAVAAAQRTLQRHGVDAVSARAADAISWLQSRSGLRRPDVLVVDPPRAGLKSGVAVVAGAARRCIVYCSCNEQSFASDARFLAGAGFVLEELTLFDMFPHTAHVELTGWFVRSSSTIA